MNPVFALLLAASGFVGAQDTGLDSGIDESSAVPPPVAQPAPFSQEFAVLQPNRLALTPSLDGRIDNEEWDPLSTDGQSSSWLQWEPGILYLAAKAPVGKDVLFSLDLMADGWLVGKDNLELKVVWQDGAPSVKARVLDATNRNEPVWVPASFIEGGLKAVGVSENGDWTVEAKVFLFGLPKPRVGKAFGVRVDVLEAAASEVAPFLPRKTALVEPRWERSVGLPPAMRWAPEYRVRNVVPGESIRIRYTFERPGTASLKRVAMRTEGLGQAHTIKIEKPFPPFDRKGRAFVDYETLIQSDAPKGYRVMRAEITGDGGEQVLAQSSYSIADLVDFEVNLPEDLTAKEDSQIIRGSVIVQSNTSKRLDGTMTVTVPETWTVSLGKVRRFTIYHSHGAAKLNLQLIAPQNARGLIPIELKAEVGTKVVVRTFFLPVW